MSISRVAFAVGLLTAPIIGLCAQPAAADDYTIGGPTDQTRYTSLSGPLVGRTTFLAPKDATADEVRRNIAAPSVATVPYWQTSFKDAKGKVFSPIFMVGENPMAHGSNKTIHVKVVVIPVKITMGTTVFDPTTVDTLCQPKGSAISLIKKSPLFNNFALKVGGRAVGTGQYADLFQRGNFYKFVKPGGLNPNFKFVLDASYASTLSVTVHNGTVVPVTCGNLGIFDQGDWDSFAQNVITSNKSLLPPTVFPFFIFYNVVLDENHDPNNCCILGYHGAFMNPKFQKTFQAYGVGDFDSSQAFKGTQDISALTHEVNEWQDDPSGGNPTPNWGHIGQVSGCQNNLEVGDPLSGTIKPVKLNGFTYHVQDLAFVSWFYDTKPSIGINGWYSLFGTFKVPAKEPCT